MLFWASVCSLICVLGRGQQHGHARTAFCIAVVLSRSLWVGGGEHSPDSTWHMQPNQLYYWSQEGMFHWEREEARQSDPSPRALLCGVVNVQKGKVGWDTPSGRWRPAIWSSDCASYVSTDRDSSAPVCIFPGYITTHTYTNARTGVVFFKLVHRFTFCREPG